MWMYWLHWRPTIWSDMTAEESQLVDVHVDYVKRLYDEGRVVLAGAVHEPAQAMLFFEADSEEDACAILAADPLSGSGIVEMTLHQFNAGFVGGRAFDLTADGGDRDEADE